MPMSLTQTFTNSRREQRRYSGSLIVYTPGVFKQKSRFRKRRTHSFYCFLLQFSWKMKKGIHPQMQWISYVTQSGRLMHVMMTKIHHVGKVYHLKAKHQMAESVGQIAKFRQRYEKGITEKPEN